MGTTAIIGLVYAPNADISNGGTPTVYGAVIGRKVHDFGNAEDPLRPRPRHQGHDARELDDGLVHLAQVLRSSLPRRPAFFTYLSNQLTIS